MKEIKKCLPIKSKVKLVFIAPDLECVPVSGGIEDEIQNLLSMATIQQIPYLFSIPRRTLGSITYKPPVSCC
ncbi:selenocysteine insertion sequence-binding protein 2 [Diaphorina citri]|uniref:Selenocysteine insertion sequence-binding protein 2 n=1 Tax=Diaphorina citri TaxID=121845 RepID=A0A1S4ER95_DIACI|nr:selenocysteine insertion sequence-binding protein 2 [Diaphorina citri]